MSLNMHTTTSARCANWFEPFYHSRSECIHVCVYVCMHVCLYVCMYVNMLVCTYVWFHVLHMWDICTYIYMCVCVCVCMYVCVYIHQEIGQVHSLCRAPPWFWQVLFDPHELGRLLFQRHFPANVIQSLMFSRVNAVCLRVRAMVAPLDDVTTAICVHVYMRSRMYVNVCDKI
jgi:hypothetical protein